MIKIQRKKTLFLFFCFQLILISASAQKDDFRIYVIPGRYDTQDQNFFSLHDIYERYYWIGRPVLTPKRDGVVNENTIKEYLDRAFPDRNDSGILSLDLEGETMENLREFPPSDPRFKKSEETYLQMVRIVKKYRPNVKVGIYGLPFRFYTKDSYDESYDKKIYNILKEVDYISPSLYIRYPEIERGFNFNKSYLELSLERLLKITTDLNKEAIPYVWHVVHPVNKLHGGKVMSAEEIERYTKLIKDYTYQGSKVSGLLWWEEPTSSNYSFRKAPPLTRPKSPSFFRSLFGNGNAESVNKNVIIEATKVFVK